ncbi:translation initiation factor 1A/IF-1 [Ceratocystis lukuohia]|uniref:S1-like domain-containing protein n=3 Tax=Ceratocystis TaxID=5157 RepID=A0A0F8BT35_CERFI|nr:S1-like domain-containing protein [Ceratocystis platani]PHH55342.1 S1-like domain-containing protein [Ceratocystis fimbriata CBS 114723]
MAKKKNFTHNVRDDDVEAPRTLEDGQTIARVLKATSANAWECELPSKKNILVQLQSKLHNNVWVRRGGFVLIGLYPEAEVTSKIMGEIVNVVLDEKKWRKMPYWPKEFPLRTFVDDDSEEEESNMGKLPPSDSEDED